MHILITGSPGTGKTKIARLLGKQFHVKVINEIDFALAHKIGHWNHEIGELEIPLGRMKTVLGKEIRKNAHVIVEGHTLCEMKLPIDLAIVLRVHPEVLETRLEQRNYNAEKTMDNVFCEGIDYCLKHAKRNYGIKKVVEVRNEKQIKGTLSTIHTLIQERGLDEARKKKHKNK